MDFFHKLLLSHIGFGEIAGFLFLVIAIEVFNRSERGLARAKVLSAIGAISALLSWCVGGYYYVVHYGNAVKPIIIAESSQLKWAHKIVLEAKEHFFLFIPILAIVAFVIFAKTARWDEMDDATSKKVGVLCLLIFVLVVAVAMTGAVVSTSVRTLIGGGI